MVISDEGFNVFSVDFGQKTQPASISRTSTRLFANVTIGHRSPYSRPTSCPSHLSEAANFLIKDLRMVGDPVPFEGSRAPPCAAQSGPTRR